MFTAGLSLQEGENMDVLERLKKYVSIPSIFPDERDFAFELAEELRKYDFNVDLDEYVKGRFNVLGKRGNPRILFLAHLDTVPVSMGMEEPFMLKVDGDRAYGLGAYDMKAGIAVIMDLAENTDYPFGVLFTSDEENISLGSYHALNYNLDFDFCLSPEIMDVPQGHKEGDIIVARRGRIVMEVNTTVESGHGALKGRSAIDECIRGIRKLEEMPVVRHRFFSNSWFIRRIYSESKALSYPETCSFDIDYHLVPGEDAESVVETVRSITNLDVKLKERETPYMMPYDFSDSSYVDVLAKASKEVYGRYALKGGLTVADENRIALKMPVFSVGPFGKNAHNKNEWVSISSIFRLRKFYEEVLNRLV